MIAGEGGAGEKKRIYLRRGAAFADLQCLNALAAGVHREMGRSEPAAREYREALALHREVGNRRFEAITLGERASLYLLTGRLSAAEQGYAEALSLHRKVRNRRAEGAHLCGHALVLLARGLADSARDAWRQGASILRELGDTCMLDLVSKKMKEACGAAGRPAFDEPPGP